MRILSFVIAIVACLLYGLAFDAVVAGIFDGLVCQLVPAAACPIPARADHWIGFTAILVVIPMACYLAHYAFFRILGSLRTTTLFGLLIFS